MNLLELGGLASALVAIITLISKLVTLIVAIQALITKIDTMQEDLIQTKLTSQQLQQYLHQLAIRVRQLEHLYQKGSVAS